ncbi:toll/interleukin-1 receptor domain-containing protein [Maribacter algarum]|uniref:Toll/interleukin-1 receptor domain-containing protein n=1 Tax=Maribacter algarum (ex Zhang et al. 2020) TaxID=2578118 RepID=A0A5S3QJM4_9FLAO|nr:toll/interleukin-1 receptor domain-containing protein [Maribacter algarum]TMM58024.1 toll/interleukin-1 receptor domain-containing protein [Maribacter algarum]
MQKSDIKPSVYISYAWNPESEAIAEFIEVEFKKRGVEVIRDKNDLKYKGRIKRFMDKIGRGKYVILVISKKYLRSENCMFELLQIFKNQNFYERIFPVVLDEVKIARAADRLDLLKYWENETVNLDKKIRELKELANIQGVAEDLNLYTEIRNNISGLTNILKDINTLNVDLHINSDFQQLCDLVQSKIKSDFKGKRTSPIKKGIIAFTLIFLLLFMFQGIRKSDFLNKSKKLRDSTAIAKVRYDSIQNLRKKDSLYTLKKKQNKKIEKEATVPYIAYDVKLIVPSNMSKAEVFVDNKPAEIIERNLIFIKIRLHKKNGMHRFTIKNGDRNCFTDHRITKNNMRLTLCD